MANINLITEDVNKKKASLSETGTIWGLVILFLVLALYGGILFYKSRVANEINQVKSEYGQKYNQAVVGQAKEMADFQNRLTIAGKLIGQGKNMSDNLTAIEKSMLLNVYLDSYKYDDKSSAITVGCVGDNYNVVAKQITAFKNSSYFSGVTGGKTTFNKEKNKINFDIDLKIK